MKVQVSLSMKMAKEDYVELKTILSKRVNLLGKEKIKAYKEGLKTDSRVKDLERRFRWDLFWSIPQKEREVIHSKFKNLTDDNIDVALKKIVKELGIDKL